MAWAADVSRLRVEAHPDGAALAVAAARLTADGLTAAVTLRGRATLALSGGKTPGAFFAALAATPLPWERIAVFQVDERLAPSGHPERNATLQRRAFAPVLRQHGSRFHWMPVEDADPVRAGKAYVDTLEAAAGSPPVLDVVHLGLGPDGHTASLFPGGRLDADGDVAVTDVHAGWRRMTMTFPIIDRARLVLFLVSGEDRRQALAALLRGDAGCVAARVRAERIVVLADAAARG
jgi:6-phosphogluconolactonase